MAKKKEASLLDLPCSFGNVSFGKKTARVSVTVDREELKLAVADKNLCDRRLMLTIHADGNGDQEGQGRLQGMEDDLDITGSADVKGFGVHSTTISFGLTFNSVEMKKTAAATGIQFNDFAGRNGRVMVAQVDEIPADEGSDESEEEGEGEE